MSAIRVLHIGVSTEAGVFGGVEKYLIDYYSHINHDKVIFDFVFCRANSLARWNDKALLKDSHVMALHVLKDRDNSMNNYIELYKKIDRILKENNYEIIHINTSLVPAQVVCLIASKLNGYPIRIAHSHSAGNLVTGNKIKQAIKKIIYRMSRGVIRTLATDYFACSREAGTALFGSKGVESKKFHIIRNAIDTEKYRYDAKIREKIREKFGVNESTIIFGSVGRLDPVKNLFFLIDVFEGCHCLNNASQLWLVGAGFQRDTIMEYIKKKGLGDSIKMLGERNDVEMLMQGMDVFLFTSFKEGLGIVAIEAQAAGLPVYASDTIPNEAQITKLIKFVPLSEGSKKWAEIINRDIKGLIRKDMYEAVMKSGYDINATAKELEQFYVSRNKGAM